MGKIRMEIKLSNGKDEHVLKFDEGDLKIMIAALYDWHSADDYVTLYDGGGDYE